MQLPKTFLNTLCAAALCAGTFAAENAPKSTPKADGPDKPAAPATKDPEPPKQPPTPKDDLPSAPPRASIQAPPGPPKPKDVIESIPMGKLEDGVILQAGDIKIPFSSVERVENAYMVSEKKAQPRAQMTPELQARLRKGFAFQFFVNTLIENYAKENKLDLPKEKFDEQFDKFKKEVSQNGKISYEQGLINNGLVDDELRQFKNASWAIEEKLSESLKDTEMHEAFEQAKDAVPMRRTSHILFMYKGSTKSEVAKPPVTRTREEAKALAEETLKKIKADGKVFDELVKGSDCPSRTQGGDLDYSAQKGPKSMPEPFSDAEYKMEKVGDISDVVETPFGFHIIKLTGIKTEADFKQDIRRFMIRQKYNKQMEQLIEQHSVGAKFNEKMFTVAPPKDKEGEAPKANP